MFKIVEEIIAGINYANLCCVRKMSLLLLYRNLTEQECFSEIIDTSPGPVVKDRHESFTKAVIARVEYY